MSSDNSFWQKLSDQQTTTTVGLGYVTTNPEDPSVSYWPGPGRLPSFTLGREWITHYTSAKYSSNTNDSSSHGQSLSMDDFGHLSHTTQSAQKDSFVSDVLITYKLKNPAQFLRDVFRADEILEFASRFAGASGSPSTPPLYMITGYKVSRNVSTALDQQSSRDTGLRFELSRTLSVPAAALKGGGGPPAGPHVDGDAGHKALSMVSYQAPGDSIFFVRYQRIQLDRTYPSILCIPPRRLGWAEWFAGGMCGKQSRTIVLPPDEGGVQRLLITTDSVAVAVRKMHEMKALAATGRRTTFVSGDDVCDANVVSSS